MFKINIKTILINFLIILIIFLVDRVSKIYILKLAEIESVLNIYLTPYLNLYLIWNKGIAFGLLSFNESAVYNSITFLITFITIVILILVITTRGLKRYSLISVFGGSIGNLWDRIYYSAVPDFIDFHINNFHWFIFNVADIFITIGVICLIYEEIFNNNNKNEKFI